MEFSLKESIKEASCPSLYFIVSIHYISFIIYYMYKIAAAHFVYLKCVLKLKNNLWEVII